MKLVTDKVQTAVQFWAVLCLSEGGDLGWREWRSPSTGIRGLSKGV